MATYLITGSSRGLSLALVKPLVDLPHSQASKIFATARSNAADPLQDLGHKHPSRVIFVRLDPTSSLVTATPEFRRFALWAYTGSGWSERGLNEVFNANVTSVQMGTRAFLPLLSKGTQKKVINIYKSS
jgi:NAD(P)-dependent dehydrogenase (short-subunit alcohol dehydrogenase family)